MTKNTKKSPGSATPNAWAPAAGAAGRSPPQLEKVTHDSVKQKKLILISEILTAQNLKIKIKIF